MPYLREMRTDVFRYIFRNLHLLAGMQTSLQMVSGLEFRVL